MGYFLTTELGNAVPGRSHVESKTHTPFLFVKERGHRSYSPAIERWLSRDRIGERTGLNAYWYARNNSVYDYDPLGLCSSADSAAGSSITRPPVARIPITPGSPSGNPVGKTIRQSVYSGGGRNDPPPNPYPFPIVSDCVCPQGSHIGKRPRTGYDPRSDVNGCGQPGWTRSLLNELINIVGYDEGNLDEPMLGCSFRNACNNHDACYNTCNKSRATCDADIETDIQAACNDCAERFYGGGRGTTTGRMLFEAKCWDLAALYSRAVSRLGKSFYNAAQKKGCEDCCCF